MYVYNNIRVYIILKYKRVDIIHVYVPISIKTIFSAILCMDHIIIFGLYGSKWGYIEQIYTILLYCIHIGIVFNNEMCNIRNLSAQHIFYIKSLNTIIDFSRYLFQIHLLFRILNSAIIYVHAYVCP